MYYFVSCHLLFPSSLLTLFSATLKGFYILCKMTYFLVKPITRDGKKPRWGVIWAVRCDWLMYNNMSVLMPFIQSYIALVVRCVSMSPLQLRHGLISLWLMVHLDMNQISEARMSRQSFCKCWRWKPSAHTAYVTAYSGCRQRFINNNQIQVSRKNGWWKRKGQHSN